MTKTRKGILLHQTTTKAEGWTACERRGHTMFYADGEVIPAGYPQQRPATKAEIKAEQVRRAEKAERLRRIEEFQARPEWSLASDIRSTIECMEHNHHPLDRLTLAEWQALRNKICG